MSRDTPSDRASAREAAGAAGLQRAVQDQLAHGPVDARVQRQGAVGGSPTQALTDSSCACLNTIGLDLCEKWWGTASHSRTINPDIDSCRLRRIQEPHSGHVFRPSAFPARWSDLAHPVVAGLISVIVNYGGTFILVFQAAKAAGLSPELTASWVWSVSIGVGVTGLVLSWAAREPIITAWSTPAAAFLVTALATTPYAEAVGAWRRLRPSCCWACRAGSSA